MIWKVGNDKAIELLIHNGYSVNELLISDDLCVSVLNHFGTSLLLEDEQIENEILTQNIELNEENDSSLFCDSSETFDDALYINLYDEEDFVKTSDVTTSTEVEYSRLRLVENRLSTVEF